MVYPYYNDDRYFEIQLSNNHNTAFFAYVTIVRKTIAKDKCKIRKNETTTSWLIDTWKRGDFLNVKCYFEVIIPATTEIVVTVKRFIVVEENVDYIRYYSGKYNNSVIVDMDLLKDTVFKLYNYNNGSNQHYLFEYQNDGSVPSIGDVISFNTLSCKCIGPIIPCSHLTGVVTGIMNSGYKYCGNLKCSFVIEPCAENKTSPLSEITLLQLSFEAVISDSAQDESDSFLIYSNGNVVLQIILNYIEFVATNYQIYLNSSNYNTLEVRTFETFKRTFFPPVYSQVEISLLHPFTVIDTGLYVSGVVEVSLSQEIMNQTFSVFSNLKHSLPIYNNASLSINYYSRECFGDLNPYSCKINSNKVAFFSPEGTENFPILTIQLQDLHQIGCVFKNYIFATKELSFFPFVIIANSEDICLSTLLISVNINYHYFISDLWTTSERENIKIYAGTQNLLFEFNSKTAKKWTSIGLYTGVYTVKVPKSTTVFLNLQKLEKGIHDNQQ